MHRGTQSQPPPTRASLKAWWKQFSVIQKVKKEAASDPNKETHTVFGIPLKESLQYASVQISTANADGEMFVWGYIPVVVAKCGLYLKENATEVEGTFRVSGSNKRMRELQAIFETPPRYGKSIDWKHENFTTHDVASVFRRYLTQMPEPVVPHKFYNEFRDVYSSSRPDEIIAAFKKIILSMPRSNQYLLLYVLDLLSVFARKSDKNLMPASNLAVIFRPGILAHPSHDMAPKENELSQQVLEFLIANQDWFMLDIPPPPQSSQPGSAIASPVNDDDLDDVVVVPSSDEDQSSSKGPKGGWKLVERAQRRGRIQEKAKIDRRRTTSERPARMEPKEDLLYAAAGQPRRSGELSPVSETSINDDVILSGLANASVSRSHTLPSNSLRGASSSSSSNPVEESLSPKEGGRHILRKSKPGPLKQRSRPTGETNGSPGHSPPKSSMPAR
ncbi:Rho GTPase activation protein [Sistotremastrum suecicum HHB10207 ss-3]|uniref:Rho GTPase activation protein n=1 Tax=Sistotremastrum suecicum HHB10207 ss-3 TaxID=1314776 RepID=A0A166EX20_9AGAM|nr:Rho GTPase activation protein [Sistotremastrum suecicum HHB10207 ss-3]